MHALLSAAGRAFLRAFAADLVTLAPGILAAPSLEASGLLGVAALMSCISAGIRSLQAYAPKLSFDAWVGPNFGRYLDAFAQTGIGYLCVAIPAILVYPVQGGWSLVGAGIVSAFLGAVSRGIQALGNRGEAVTKANAPDAGGIKPPPKA